ncbi:MAG: hypothetical protein GC201_16195 [Alphaproteobacteria bacterium]|nr:hypothetical protein [Alphaproteobacteria bacterium]
MSRRVRLGLLALLAVGAAFLLLEAERIGGLAVDVSAKWACQCRYIDGGDDRFCAREDPIGFGGTRFRFDPGQNAATASIWGLFQATGTYRPDVGCRVE